MIFTERGAFSGLLYSCLCLSYPGLYVLSDFNFYYFWERNLGLSKTPYPPHPHKGVCTLNKLIALLLLFSYFWVTGHEPVTLSSLSTWTPSLLAVIRIRTLRLTSSVSWASKLVRPGQIQEEGIRWVLVQEGLKIGGRGLPWRSSGSALCFQGWGQGCTPWLGNSDPACRVAQPKTTKTKNRRQSFHFHKQEKYGRWQDVLQRKVKWERWLGERGPKEGRKKAGKGLAKVTCEEARDQFLTTSCEGTF